MVEFRGVRRLAVPGLVAAGLLATPVLVAPAEAAPRSFGRHIPNQWIVTFDASASDRQIDTARAEVEGGGGKVGHRYRRVARGFSANMTSTKAEQLRRSPHVLAVEPDLVVSAADVQSPTPNWGLDRIDQSSRPLNGSYTYANDGAGVTVYVIDTGIRTTHSDFGGRASQGFSAIDDNYGASDCDGHGTHVAGIVGGKKYGVAKGVKLVSVRVLDCEGLGSMSGVIAGVEWVTANRTGPSVANMSLGGEAHTALDKAVATSIASGVTFAIAAGNDETNACNQSPGRTPTALTVGASTKSDARLSYSNYGPCVDLFAPGADILSADRSSDTATDTLSGTSMAAPHVAGAAAAYLHSHPTATPAQVRAALVGGATLDRVSSLLGSPNVLLRNVGTALAPPPAAEPADNTAPVALAPSAATPGAVVKQGSPSVAVTLRWSAVDAQRQEIARYELQEQRGSTANWSTVYSGPSTVGIRWVTSGTAMRWRVRATDAFGAVGAWATGDTRTVTNVQQSSSRVEYGKDSSWSTKSVSDALGGKVRRSRTSGATASLTFTGSKVGWVATQGRDRGRAEVFVDGVSRGIVDLYASSTHARRVVFSATLAPGSHTIRIKVLGKRSSKASNSYVDLDAFTVLR